MVEPEKIKNYYDGYVGRQVNVGVNARHYSIFNKSIENGMQSTDSVLEIGCGIGTYTQLLLKEIRQGKVMAVDISPKSVEIARKSLGHYDNLTLMVCDVTQQDFNILFDTIVLPDVIEHIPLELHWSLFQKLVSLLNEDGRIFIHIPNPYYLRWCHENRPDVLQIIDQPVYTDTLVSNLYPHGLYIHKLETYSIWVEQCDYQFIVVKKDIARNYQPIVQHKSLINRLKQKLKKTISSGL